MSNQWGEAYRVQIFGESHGPAVGVILDGVEAGLRLDPAQIETWMVRRAPGGDLTSPRQEADTVEIVSGVQDGITTGAPICGMIRNTGFHSRDYDSLKNKPRPSHADYTAHCKYHGAEDLRGGGHFSARVTAGLVFAGAVAEQALRRHLPAYLAGSHILQCGSALERKFTDADCRAGILQALSAQKIPTLEPAHQAQVEERIRRAATEQDSVGAILETAVIGLPAGLGDPFFDSLESRIAHLAFSIPALKGIEFGAGFALGAMAGSEANDAFILENGQIRTAANHSGGIQGGITNGMPVIVRMVFKPTPSIGKPQKTVDLAAMQETEITIEGRHDPCVGIRAVPIIEAAIAIAVYDAWLSDQRYRFG